MTPADGYTPVPDGGGGVNDAVVVYVAKHDDFHDRVVVDMVAWLLIGGYCAAVIWLGWRR